MTYTFFYFSPEFPELCFVMFGIHC